MHKDDHTSDFNFREADKFLENILELRKITTKLLESREEMNASLERLNHVVQSLHDEIHQSVNKNF